MRTFIEIVNAMLAAGREGDIVTRQILADMLEDPKIQADNADLLDAINY